MATKHQRIDAASNSRTTVPEKFLIPPPDNFSQFIPILRKSKKRIYRLEFFRIAKPQAGDYIHHENIIKWLKSLPSEQVREVLTINNSWLASIVK